MSLTEHEDQKALAKVLDTMGLLWFHPANEARRSLRLAAMLKAAGMKAGIPDAIIFDKTKHGHVGCAVELKAGKNKPTREQLEWLAELEVRGWLCLWGQLWSVLPRLKDAYGK